VGGGGQPNLSLCPSPFYPPHPSSPTRNWTDPLEWGTRPPIMFHFSVSFSLSLSLAVFQAIFKIFPDTMSPDGSDRQVVLIPSSAVNVFLIMTHQHILDPVLTSSSTSPLPYLFHPLLPLSSPFNLSLHSFLPSLPCSYP